MKILIILRISLDTQNCIRSMLEINEDKRIGWADLSEKIEDIC
jgi:hypothetical protein